MSKRSNSDSSEPKQEPNNDGSISEIGEGGIPDPEVVDRAVRRRFTGKYKARILREADACSKPGELGALLRREGLYHSHLSTWSRQREQGALNGLSAKRRGRRSQRDPKEAEVKRLQRENERLRVQLSKAETIIEVQKKLSELLEGDRSERS